jgi:hypothetical protein
MSILDTLLSVASGGVTGLVGTAVQSIFQYQSKKLDIELEKQKGLNELEERKLDIQMQAQEWASRTQIAQVTAQGEVDKADAETLAESYKLEPQQYSEKSLLTHMQNWLFVLVDTFKALIRPSLTVYLCTIVTIIYIQTRGLINTNQSDSFALLEKLINTILYITTSVILWWFGSRGTKSKQS